MIQIGRCDADEAMTADEYEKLPREEKAHFAKCSACGFASIARYGLLHPLIITSGTTRPSIPAHRIVRVNVGKCINLTRQR
jgi:hypothetical protein